MAQAEVGDGAGGSADVQQELEASPSERQRQDSPGLQQPEPSPQSPDQEAGQRRSPPNSWTLRPAVPEATR